MPNFAVKITMNVKWVWHCILLFLLTLMYSMWVKLSKPAILIIHIYYRMFQIFELSLSNCYKHSTVVPFLLTWVTIKLLWKNYLMRRHPLCCFTTQIGSFTHVWFCGLRFVTHTWGGLFCWKPCIFFDSKWFFFFLLLPFLINPTVSVICHQYGCLHRIKSCIYVCR